MHVVRDILRKLALFAARMIVGDDTIDTTDWEARVEQEFQVALPADEAARLRTMGDLCALIIAQKKLAGASASEDEVWFHLRAITSEEFGIAPSELHPEIRFKEDLLF